MKQKALFLLLFICTYYPLKGETFLEKNLMVTSSVDGLRMGATLTSPNHPKGSIVLATGSGIQNRDEEIFGKKPFKFLAEFLSSNGYAVLRVDDRGLENPTDAQNATIETIRNDVFSAVNLIDSIFPNIPKGIIGHSCGGNYAMAIAANYTDIDFIITLAAPAWQVDSIVMSQTRTIAKLATGKWEKENLQRNILKIAKSNLPLNTKRMYLSYIISEDLGEITKMPEVQLQINDQINALLSPWYQSFLKYDPSNDIKKIKCKFLALNGSKDCQVLQENLITFSTLNSNVDTKSFENLNHLFQKCTLGGVDEYPYIQEDISQEVLQTILDWLNSFIF